MPDLRLGLKGGATALLRNERGRCFESRLHTIIEVWAGVALLPTIMAGGGYVSFMWALNLDLDLERIRKAIEVGKAVADHTWG